MLALVKESGETEKIPDPRTRLIGLFNEDYQQKTGKRNPVNFGWCMKMLEKQFVVTEEDSGGCWIEYPDIETWQEQVRGFFKDEFARVNRKFHFSYLMKQWGSFGEIEKRKPPTDIILTYTCKNGHENRMKRSQWQKFANRPGKCGMCDEKFSVNDVLDQVPSIQQFT